MVYKTLLTEQRPDTRLPVCKQGASWAFSQRTHASRMFFPPDQTQAEVSAAVCSVRRFPEACGRTGITD